MAAKWRLRQRASPTSIAMWHLYETASKLSTSEIRCSALIWIMVSMAMNRGDWLALVMERTLFQRRRPKAFGHFGRAIVIDPAGQNIHAALVRRLLRVL